MHRVSDLDDGSADELAKALFITEFFAQGYTAHEHDLLTKNGDFEYLAWVVVIKERLEIRLSCEPTVFLP